VVKSGGAVKVFSVSITYSYNIFLMICMQDKRVMDKDITIKDIKGEVVSMVSIGDYVLVAVKKGEDTSIYRVAINGDVRKVEFPALGGH